MDVPGQTTWSIPADTVRATGTCAFPCTKNNKRKGSTISFFIEGDPRIYTVAKIIKYLQQCNSHASCPIHTAPPMLSLDAPVTDDMIVFSCRHLSTPIKPMISA